MKIKLLERPHDPLKSIAHAIEVMTGKGVEDCDLEKVVLDLRNTGLQGALEQIHFTFSLEGVSRAFTHQLVRYRTASFNQESMRFVKVEGEGEDWYYKPEGMTLYQEAMYDSSMRSIKRFYENLLDLGCPTEVARGVLPTNVLTKIDVALNFRTLVNICETRLCLQAQKGEWGEFATGVKKLIEEEVEGGEVLAQFLQAICYRTKRCEFKSLFDRPCPIQAKWEKGL